MKRCFFILLALAACDSGRVTVSNETQYDVDTAAVIEMVYRIWPTADSEVHIRLLPEGTDAMDVEGAPGERKHGAGVDEIRVIYKGCLGRSSTVTELSPLAHELIHWRCDHLYGDSDMWHTYLDWELWPVVDAEFSCE